MSDAINPKHYQPRFDLKDMQCIEITRHMDFDLGNAFKYVWRAGDKDDLEQDIKKAEWYIEDYCEHITSDDAMETNKPRVAAALFNLLEVPEDDLEMYRWKLLNAIITLFYAKPDSVLYDCVKSDIGLLIQDLVSKFREKKK